MSDEDTIRAAVNVVVKSILDILQEDPIIGVIDHVIVVVLFRQL
jgi:hypothetical protein